MEQRKIEIGEMGTGNQDLCLHIDKFLIVRLEKVVNKNAFTARRDYTFRNRNIERMSNI